MIRLRRLPIVAVLVLLAVVGRPGIARSAPADPLLRLVPPGTGICVVVQNSRDHAKTLTQSPFAAWFVASPLAGRLVPESDRERFRQFEDVIRTNLGVTAAQLRDDVFGDAVVFAYQPGPAGKPEAESGILLVRPRQPDLVSRLIVKLNELQVESGEVRTVRTIAYRGREYTARDKPNGVEYYLLGDGVFAFTSQESAIQAVIDRDATVPPLADTSPPIAAGLRRVRADTPWLAVWVDPRAFDGQLTAQAEATADPRERAFLVQFGKVWSACDGLAVTAHPSRELELTVAAIVHPERLPSELAGLATDPAGPSPLWSVVPADALFAIVGRVGPTPLLDAADSFVAPAGRDGLHEVVAQNLGPIVGRNRLDDLLAGVGPNWGLWVEAPSGDDGHVPAWTLAVQLGSADPNVPPAILQAVELLAQLGRIAYNQSHADQIDFRVQKHNAVTVRSLANDSQFPTGFRPAFGLVGEYLVFASVPDRVAAFPAVVEVRPAGPTVPVLRISARGVWTYLEGHREPITGALAMWSGQPENVVRSELRKVTEVLSAFDRVEVTQDAADGVVRMTATVRFVEPLAK